MKALTVLQPWAQILILGAKQFELRSWKTRHRGTLLIHAGLTMTEQARELCAMQPFRRILSQGGFKSPTDLPRGVLLGTVTLIDCLPAAQVLFDGVEEAELALGDFRPGHWAWKVSDALPLAEPIPCQGTRGIFEVLFPHLDDVCVPSQS